MIGGTNVGSIFYDLKLDTSHFDNQAQKLGNDLHKLGKTMAVGLAVATGAAVAFGVSAVKSFQDSENVAAQLNAVLKSTGGVAGVTAKQAEELASSLQKVTRFSDETIQTGENMLLTFTAIGKDIFPQATETMLNMSQALGQDVKSSAIQLGKALQDPILGVTALRRVGVNFNDAQQETIKKLVEGGKAAEAQRLILKELEIEFGGSAKAAGKTFAGQMDILKNSVDDVKESIGKTIVSALTPMAARLSTFVSSDQFQKWLEKAQLWLGTNLPIAFKYITDTLIPAFIGIIKAVGPTLLEFGKIIVNLIQWLSDHTYVIWGLVAAFVAWKTAMMITGVIQAIGIAFTSMQTTSVIAMSVVRGAFTVMAATVATPIALVISVVAALAAIALVFQSLQRLNNELDKANRAVQGAGQADDAFYTSLRRARDEGRISQTEFLRRTAAYNKRAMGGSVKANTPYMVGERGREMFVPNQSGTIVPNNTVEKMGQQQVTSTATTNINGDIILQDKSAVDSFFARLNRNSELARKGMATI